MVSEAQQKKRPGVFQRLFGPRDQPPNKATPPHSSSRRSSSPTKRRIGQASGTRTLCVRTCDGYYFPISYSTNRKRFKIDEAVCKAMYGGATANLYVHDNGSPADTAISLGGKRLAAEPYAFAFRQTFNESCQAELKGGLTRLGAAFAMKAAKTQSTATVRNRKTLPGHLPDPLSRVVVGTDPETLANRAGHFTVAPVTPQEDAAIALAPAPIRKLGSDYYYASPIVIETLRDPPPLGPEFTLIGSAEAAPRHDHTPPREHH